MYLEVFTAARNKYIIRLDIDPVAPFLHFIRRFYTPEIIFYGIIPGYYLFIRLSTAWAKKERSMRSEEFLMIIAAMYYFFKEA